MKKEQSVLEIILKYYLFTIVFPFFLRFNISLSKFIAIDNPHSIISELILKFNQVILFSGVCAALFFLFKKKWKVSIVLLIVPFIMIIFLLSSSLYSELINEDKIYYYLNKNKFLEIIKKSDSVAQDGKGKLVKIPMIGNCIGCDKYLVYDETDEMANPKGSFRGIDYVNIYNRVTKEKMTEKADKVLINKVDKNIYTVCFCLNICE